MRGFDGQHRGCLDDGEKDWIDDWGLLIGLVLLIVFLVALLFIANGYITDHNENVESFSKLCFDNFNDCDFYLCMVNSGVLEGEYLEQYRSNYINCEAVK